MKSRSVLRNIVFSILVSANAIIVFFVFIKSSGSHSRDIVSRNEDYAIKSLLMSIKGTYESEGLYLDFSSNYDSLFVLALQNKMVFVLRLTEYQCESCAIAAISDFTDLIKGLSGCFIVLTSYSNDNSFKAFRQSHQEMVVLNEIDLQLPIEKLNTPYMFLMDNKMQTDMVFLHQKEFPEKTEGYFAAIKKRFSEL